MSRNSGGTYTAPANSWNPAVEGSAIDEADWNATLTDLESALTDSLDRTGKGKITAHIDFDENASPGTPDSNVGRLYVGDDGGVTTLYFKDAAGNVYNLNLAAASGLPFTFNSTTTTNADPGAGKGAFNNATISSATEMALSTTTSGAADIAAYMATWDDSGTSDRGRLLVQKRTDASKLYIFTISGANTDASGYKRIAITYVSGAGAISNADPLAITYLPPGPTGATGPSGSMSGPGSSVDSQIALFDGTVGTTLKAATTNGILKGTSGVISAAVADTDYTANAFKTISVSGQSDVVADSAADTLTLVAGSNVTITTNAGSDSITIAASGGGSSAAAIIPQNVGLAVSASASALTISLKGSDGNDPSGSNIVYLPFRSATGTTGTETTVQVTAATSLTISSGSTLGVTSSTAFRVWVVAFNDAGTIRLGAVNCVTISSSRPTAVLGLIDDSLGSSTAEGGAGAADSAGEIYTGTAVSEKAYRILGYVEWNTSGVTAGTWTTTNLSTVQVWSPGMPAPGMPTGNRAVVVKTDTFTSTTAGSYTDITGFNVSITPKSAANMVRVIGGWNNIGGGANVAASRLVRGSTAIDVGDSWTGVQATSTIFRTTDAVSINFNGCDYLDNPASTSSTTYKVQFYLQGDTYYFNRSITSASSPQPRTSSTISVEEIMG